MKTYPYIAYFGKNEVIVNEHARTIQCENEYNLPFAKKLKKWAEYCRAIGTGWSINGCHKYRTIEHAFFVEKEQETNEAELWDEVQKIISDPEKSIGTKTAYLKSKYSITRKHQTK